MAHVVAARKKQDWLKPVSPTIQCCLTRVAQLVARQLAVSGVVVMYIHVVLLYSSMKSHGVWDAHSKT